MILWNSEQYAIKGMDRAMYRMEKRSSRKSRRSDELGNSQSKIYRSQGWYLRRCKPVEGQQEQHKPKDGVYRLDRKLGGCEQQGE